MAAQILTQEYLKSVVEYKDNNLYWSSSRQKIKAGTLAGTVSSNGYRVIQLNCKIYKAHRLIFLYHHGYLPNFVDHIDGNKLNNAIENLRPATKSQNCQNKKLQNNNKSGIKGVYWLKRNQKWAVQINVNNKRIFLGVYKDIEFAELVSNEARLKYHQQFARKI